MPFQKGNKLGRQSKGRPSVLTEGQKKERRGEALALARRDPQQIINLARQYTVDSVRMLVKLMKDEKQPGAVRAKCAEIIIERGYGKAAQAITIEDNSLLGAGAQALSIAEKIVALRMAQDRGATIDLENSQLKLVEAVPAEAVEDLVG